MVMPTEGITEARRYPSPLVKQDLAKLGKDAESRRAALSSLRAVVEEHLQGPALGRFVHQLEDSSEGRRHAAAIITDLARVHGDRLFPHIPRLLQILAHTLLASAACPALRSECAKAVVAIGKHSVASSPSSVELILKRLCLPLIALLPHKVELLSAGSAACLGALVQSETWKYATSSLVSKLCLKASMALASKSAQTVPHISLLRALASANSATLTQFSIPLLRLLNQEILLCASTSWQLRLSAIQLIELLLKAPEHRALGSHLGSLLATLVKYRLDKMPHVRKAAMSALRTADMLASKADMKQKLVEDLPPVHAQTEPNSPLHHSLDALDDVEDVIKASRSSLGSQRSHALFLSPRMLNEIATNSPSARQLGSQTPLSDYSPGPATTDDSDYFCAYFFDTKENVSCRKIVHHIHDAVTGLGTPPSSPLKQSQKVTVPPLPLSSVPHHGSTGQQASKGCQSQSAASTPSSIMRHVTVLNSHAELVASCKRTLLVPDSAVGDAPRQQESSSNCIMEMNKLKTDAALESSNNMLDASLNVDFIKKSSKSQAEWILTEQQMQAMEDLQAISSRLLEIRESEEEQEDVIEKEHGRKQQTQSFCEFQGRIQDDAGEGKATGGGASPSDGVSKGRHEEYSNEPKEDCSVVAEASFQPEVKEGPASEDDPDEAETSSGEWSVRDNPIADSQVCQRPVPDMQWDIDRKLTQDFANGITHPNANASSTSGTVGNETSEQTTTEVKNLHREESEEFKEAEEQQLEICEDEASETENECETERVETPRSSISIDPVEIDEWHTRPAHGGICQGGSGSSKLRSFFVGSTACLIPIAIITMAKLFHLEFLTQQTAVTDYFMPPT